MPQHCRNVVGISEVACSHEPREQCFQVIAVGFCTAQLRSQRAEGIRIDCILSLLSAETRCAHQSGPPIALDCRGYRLVLSSELRDRSPRLLFNGDCFVRRKLSTDVLQHSGEHAAAGGFVVLPRMWAIMGLVGLVDGDVSNVGVTAPRHRHVEGLPGHGRVHEYVSSIGGEALRTEGRHGITEFNVFCDVVSW